MEIFGQEYRRIIKKSKSHILKKLVTKRGIRTVVVALERGEKLDSNNGTLNRGISWAEQK